MDEQKRLLIALVLMAIVVVVMTSLWPSSEPERPGQQRDAGTSAGQAEPAEPAESVEPAEAVETTRPDREQHPEQRLQLRTEKVVVEISTRGGGLAKAELQGEQLREGTGKQARQIDLVNVNIDEHPELMPLAFNLVQKQPSRPASAQSAEGVGVLRFVNDGATSAEQLEAASQVGAKVAAKVAASRPFATLEDLEAAIGGSASQKRGVLGKLLSAAWQRGYVRLDFEVIRQEDKRIVLRGRTDGDVEVVRTLSFANDWELRLVDRLRNLGKARLNLRERLTTTGLEKTGGGGGWFQRPVGQLAGLCAIGSDMIRSSRSQLAGESSGCMDMGCSGPSGPANRSGPIRFIAVDRHFFMTALSPSPSWGETTCDLRAERTGEVQASIEPVMFTELEPGSATAYTANAYLGPKQYDLLRQIGPGRRLWEAIDYGWFAPLAHILLRALRLFHGWLGNWGLSVILLTFLIKLLLLPITHKSMMSMRKMQAEMGQLKPQMDAINERYKDQADIKQQKLMELYQQNGINPLKQMTGCLPMFLQMPIWIALYRMISESVELYRAPFYFWLDDLSAHDPYYILPGLLGVAMFLQQLVTPMVGVDNAQAKMMRWMMPAMFIFIMINMPAGLVLYIFANTLLTIVQQQFINRMVPAGATPTGGKSSQNQSQRMGAEADQSDSGDNSERRAKSKRRKRK